MHLRYLAARLIRHFLPDGVARTLLRRGLIIRPGQETSDPQAAVDRYLAELGGMGLSVAGKRILVFGYGGHFAVGCGLLEAGAGHVVLCDRYAPPDDQRNRDLLSHYGTYLMLDGNKILPHPDYLSLLAGDIREAAFSKIKDPFDIVLSSFVYEHLDDVDGVTRVLAAFTRANGSHLHIIDLRDHFFRYPFEMLCYSESTWRHWLNPGSNHNRYRLKDYQAVFERYFQEVDFKILARDEEAFRLARARIRREFLTGEPEIDAVTIIRGIVSSPRGTMAAQPEEAL